MKYARNDGLKGKREKRSFLEMTSLEFEGKFVSRVIFKHRELLRFASMHISAQVYIFKRLGGNKIHLSNKEQRHEFNDDAARMYTETGSWKLKLSWKWESKTRRRGEIFSSRRAARQLPLSATAF